MNTVLMKIEHLGGPFDGEVWDVTELPHELFRETKVIVKRNKLATEARTLRHTYRRAYHDMQTNHVRYHHAGVRVCQ